MKQTSTANYCVRLLLSLEYPEASRCMNARMPSAVRPSERCIDLHSTSKPTLEHLGGERHQRSISRRRSRPSSLEHEIQFSGLCASATSVNRAPNQYRGQTLQQPTGKSLTCLCPDDHTQVKAKLSRLMFSCLQRRPLCSSSLLEHSFLRVDNPVVSP